MQRTAHKKKGTRVGKLYRVEAYFKSREEVSKIDKARGKSSRSEYLRETSLNRAEDFIRR